MACWRRFYRNSSTVFLGLVLTTLLEFSSITDAKNVSIIILECATDFQGILKHRHPNTTETTLVDPIILFYKHDIVLATEAKANAICWLSGTNNTKRTDFVNPKHREKVHYPIIQCLWHLKNIENIEILEISQYNQESLTDFYFQIDPFGNNLYWKHSASAGIWATSLRTKHSSVLLRCNNEYGGKGTRYFAIDTFQGYFFSHMYSHRVDVDAESSALRPAGAVRLRRYQTDDVVLKADSIFDGIALDHVNQTVYFLVGGNISSKSYAEALKSFPDFSYESKTSTIRYSLQYFENFSYFRVETKSVYRVPEPGKDKMEIVISNRSHAFEFSVYEDRFPNRWENPCASLNCSHLCLPEFVEENQPGKYACRCPGGQLLNQKIQCIPVYIAYNNKKGSNFVSPYNEGGDSDSVKCSTYTANNADSPEAKACRLFQHQVKGEVQIGPFGETYTISDNNCVIFYSSRPHISTTLICLPPLTTLISFSMDFQRAVLFYVERSYQGHSPNKSSYYIKNHFLASGITPPFPLISVPIDGPVSSLTLNPLKSKLYWIHNNSRLMESNYDGTDLREYRDLRENSVKTLRFAVDRLWWNFTGGEMHKKSALRFIPDETPKHVIQSTFNSSQIIDFHVFISSRSSSPCKNAACPYTCFPKIKTSICLCPEDSTPTESRTEPCKPVSVLLPHNTPGGQVILERKSVSSIVPTPLPVLQITTDTVPRLIAASYKAGTICWITAGQSPISKCYQNGSTFDVHEIDGASTLLVLSKNGRELFWNSSEEGSLYLTLLPSKNLTLNFSKFDTPGILSFALDPELKIFFWGDNQGMIHAKILSRSYDNGDSTSYNFSTNVTRDILSVVTDANRQLVYFTQGGMLHDITYQFLLNNQQEPAVLLHKHQVYSQIKNWQIHNEFLVGLDSRMANQKVSQFYVFNSRIRKLIAGSSSEKYSVFKVYGAEISKPVWNNPCDLEPCSQFCLPEIMPKGRVIEHPNYVCTCALGYNLSRDGHFCFNETHGTSYELIYMYTPYIIAVIFLFIIPLYVSLGTLHASRIHQLQKIQHELICDSKNKCVAPTELEQALQRRIKSVISPTEMSLNKKKILSVSPSFKVYSGKLLDNFIVIRTPNSGLSICKIQEFAHDIKILDYVGTHQNIQKFFGAEISQVLRGEIYAVFEASPLGTLQSYLMSKQKSEPEHSRSTSVISTELFHLDAKKALSFRAKASFCQQIADGMNYLFVKSILHSSLSTRNVLLFPSNVVKITGFLLSKCLVRNYKAKVDALSPWQWMAIEALQKPFVITSKSDAWSYGVTLWEIFTLGKTPYPEHTFGPAFVTALHNGTRPALLNEIPEQVYNDIMLPCWNSDPFSRPSFRELYSLFDLIDRNSKNPQAPKRPARLPKHTRPL